MTENTYSRTRTFTSILMFSFHFGSWLSFTWRKLFCAAIYHNAIVFTENLVCLQKKTRWIDGKFGTCFIQRFDEILVTSISRKKIHFDFHHACISLHLLFLASSLSLAYMCLSPLGSFSKCSSRIGGGCGRNTNKTAGWHWKYSSKTLLSACMAFFFVH